MTTPVHRRARTTRTAHTEGPLLPGAPTDTEKYCYYGRQHLWLIRCRTIATVSSAVSLLLFANASSALWPFWVPFTIFIGYLLLEHYCTDKKRRYSLLDHERVVSTWEPAHLPSVDVFLPSAGEELDVLANTYRHVAGLTYDGVLAVHVLDDADREDVRLLADRNGFRYHVRPNRGHLKKAGNLQYGYEHSDGELIVILDADFCPRSDFILELAPYFDDGTIGIAQSPQFFDTHRRMPWLQKCAGSMQESFYRWAQVARDTLDAPICVGTCAVYRRAALTRCGGFPQIGHSEDIYTGVHLMREGYRTVYVPVVLAKGLCPDKLSSFISQQYRWCAGSMSLLVDQSFHDLPLTYKQRMCFFTGFGYYISSAVGAYVLPIPTLAILWFLPERVQLSNFFWVLPGLMLFPVMAVMHRTSWTPQALRVYVISAFAAGLAVWHSLRGYTAEWVPTGEVRKTSTTSWITAGMLLWSIGTNLLMAVGVVQFARSGRSLVDVSPIVFYVVVNAYIWIPIAAVAWRERKERRAVIDLRDSEPARTARHSYTSDVGLEILSVQRS